MDKNRIIKLIEERRKYDRLSIIELENGSYMLWFVNFASFNIDPNKDLRKQINRILNYVDDYYGYRVIIKSIRAGHYCDEQKEYHLESICTKYFHTSDHNLSSIPWLRSNFTFKYTDIKETIDIDGSTYYKDEVIERVASLKKLTL